MLGNTLWETFVCSHGIWNKVWALNHWFLTSVILISSHVIARTVKPTTELCTILSDLIRCLPAAFKIKTFHSVRKLITNDSLRIVDMHKLREKKWDIDKLQNLPFPQRLARYNDSYLQSLNGAPYAWEVKKTPIIHRALRSRCLLMPNKEWMRSFSSPRTALGWRCGGEAPGVRVNKQRASHRVFIFF